MTVSQLIAALEKMPQDATAVYLGRKDDEDQWWVVQSVTPESKGQWLNNRERLCRGAAVEIS